jgi:hypothetical protein
MASNADVKQIQTALNAEWKTHKYYPLAVDGKIGPKTCWAAFDYQKNALGISGVRLTPQFFSSFGWDGQTWYDSYGRLCETYAGDYDWKSGSGIAAGGSNDIKQIQTALNYAWKGHKYYPLAVDGKFGPKTCYAAYDYQTRGLGISGSTLTPQFFASFGWDGAAWSAAYGSNCSSYYSQYDGGLSGGETPVETPVEQPVKPPVQNGGGGGGGGGEPVVEEPEPPPLPPVSSPFPWLAMLIGAAGGALIGLAGKKTVLKKQKRIKPAYTALGGAALGAVGGLIVGKMRQ